MSRAPLQVGTTYSHWLILSYLGGGFYQARCPSCPHERKLNLSEMERQSGCAKCRPKRGKAHKGSVLA
jgi:hypothetical protein